jgi:hypothetical protein
VIDIRIHRAGEYELLNTAHAVSRGWDITVLEGFRWDGASIPRSLWSKIGCPMDYAFESLIHDALYRSGLLDRKTADKIFHDLLIERGTSPVLAKAMYLALRIGGSSAYLNTPSRATARMCVIVLPK